MAPGQVPHHNIPWREAHSFYLLSPLMGFLSRAWSRLRGPGPPEPWLVEAVIGENQVEGGLEGEVKALAISHDPWVRHLQGEAEDSGVPEADGEAALGPCLDQASSSPPEAWGLSGDEAYSEEDANSVPREQGRRLTDGQPLSPSLLIRALQGSDKSPGEEGAEEEGVAEGVTKSSYPSSHWERRPVQEEGDEEPIEKEAPAASTSPESSGSKLCTCVYCPGEREDQATEENKAEATRKTSVSPSLSGSTSRAWGYCLGERPREKGRKACEAPGKGEPAPEPWSSVPAQRLQLGAWEYQPSKNTEAEEGDHSAVGATEKRGAEGPPSISSTSASRKAWVCQPREDTEDENSDSGSAEEGVEAEGSSPTPSESAFLKAWVYHPGEDTEEDEDGDWESTEEEGEAEASSPTPSTSALLKAWVYRPGEDTEEDEDSDWESTEEEGEAQASSPTPTTSALLKAWVYRPGEDTEEEEECEQNKDKGKDSGAAAWGQCPSPQAQSAHLRGWMYQPGKETEEEEAEEEWGETETSPFRVAIYLPGEKPPPPWAAPKLPFRLQKRLRLSQTPTQDPDPETPPKGRKVRFSEKVTVHFLAVWAGPAQAARRGPWEQLARDRSRFARRIAQAQKELGPCLTPASRARAWARLGNAPGSLAPIPASTQTSSSGLISEAPVQATPLSHAVATPLHTLSCEAPALSQNLNGRRG